MVIENRMTSPDWTDEAGGGVDGARCRNFEISRDPDGVVRNDVWFQSAEDALPVCNGDWIGTPCPMRRSCLLIALVNNDQRGVFGGLTSPQRRWVRRNIAREHWNNPEHVHQIVPKPEYFQNMGDLDPEEDLDLILVDDAEA